MNSPPRKARRVYKGSEEPTSSYQTRSRIPRTSQLYPSLPDPTVFERKPRKKRSVFGRAADAVARVIGIRIVDSPSRAELPFGDPHDIRSHPLLDTDALPNLFVTNPSSTPPRKPILSPPSPHPSPTSLLSDTFEDALETSIQPEGAWDKYLQKQFRSATTSLTKP